jgi:hypothetical protein
VLYNFTGGADGSTPDAGLARDSAGNLYGAAYVCDGRRNLQPTVPHHFGPSMHAHLLGTIFKVDRSGRSTVLYRPMSVMDEETCNPPHRLAVMGRISGGV